MGHRISVALLALAFALPLSACQEEGPMEKAGKQMDEATEEMVQESEELMDEGRAAMDDVGRKMEEVIEDLDDDE